MRSQITCLVMVLVTILTGLALGGWSTPVPITELNTANSESGPWLSNDNLTMYFSRSVDDWQLYQATRNSIGSPFGSIYPKL